MAYRDALESRRAHLERLEAELERLRSDEALLRRMPSDQGALVRVTGGAPLIERTIRLERPLDAEELARRASAAFDIEGRVAHEGDALVWRAEPEPRPRRVVIRLERDAASTPTSGGAVLRVRDERKQRSMVALFVFLGMLPYAIQQGAAVLAVVGLTALVATFVTVRGRNLGAARRRIWQAEQLARSLAADVEPVRARVEAADLERADGGSADALEEAAPRGVDRERASRG